MEKKKKNVIDNFLEYYGNREEKEYEAVYERPSKIKCILIFVITLIIMFIIIKYIFSFSLTFFLCFFIDLAFCLYYGYNLFSKKGLSIRKYVVKKKSK